MDLQNSTSTSEPVVAVGDGAWSGVEETVDDPEEVRVIFCALDSFS